MSARRESFRGALAWVFFGLVVSVLPVMAQQSIVLVAAGSELPEGLFLNWNAEYARSVVGTSIGYLPLGTDEGKRQMQQGVADLGGGDAPLTGEQLQNSRGKVIQVPVAVVGIAVVCNVPGVKQELNLTGPVLADIFLSKVTKWNDPEIAKLNPGVTLPPAGILVLHRSKGKGANYIFSDYLSRVSPEFKAKIGRGLSPNWVTGTSLARAEDVLFQVKDTDGAIAYVELNLAWKDGVALAHLRNANGEFVKPTPTSVAAAAAQAQVGEDFRGSLDNAPGKESYPIIGFTWLYVPEMAKDLSRQKEVKAYVSWLLGAGQAVVAKLGFGPLPEPVAAKAKARLALLK